MMSDEYKQFIWSGDITKGLDLSALFGAGRRIEVDIGSGMGRFLIARATNNPDVQFIGIERQKERVIKIAKRAYRNGLKNVFMIRLEAIYVLRYFFLPGTISRFYLFFPDPWPKRRHAGHRVFSPEFRSLIFSRLVEGGDLQVATDSVDYFRDMERQMANDARFMRVAPIERGEAEKTDFELIFNAQGFVTNAAGFMAKSRATIGEDTLAMYTAEDAARAEAVWTEEMPHAESVHIVGIGGVGMSAIAQGYIDAGAEVTGSDRLADSGDMTPVLEILKRQGVRISPQDGSGIGEATTLVVVSSAIEAGNLDVAEAERRNIPVIHRSEALARLMDGGRMVAIAGTCGKSTTAAMVGWCMAQSGLDPTVINGASVVGEGVNRLGSVRKGEGDFCVAEVDESDRSLLHFSPEFAIVTNEFADHFGAEETHEIFAKFKANVSGFCVDALPKIEDLSPVFDGWKTHFTYHGRRFTLRMPGLHNLYNAWQALELLSHLHISDEALYRGLLTFPGVERRLERIGKMASGAEVVDDYSHNPDKLRAAIETVRSVFGPVLVLWRPHGYGPLRKIFAGLCDLFSEAIAAGDGVVILPVYDAGGTADRSKNSDALADAILGAEYLDVKNSLEAEAFVRDRAGKYGAVLICGARDPNLPRLARLLVHEK